MKTNPFAAVAATSFAGCVLACSPIFAQTSRIPAIPIGTLSAFPTVVQSGTKPTLTWAILHPSKVSDVAEVNPPGTIILTQEMYVTVQPICTESDGSCYDNLASMDPVSPDESGWLGGWRPSLARFVAPHPAGRFQSPRSRQSDLGAADPGLFFCSLEGEVAPPPPAEIRLSLSGSPYVQLFYGTQAAVDPTKQLYIKKLAAGQTIDLGGRFVRNGSWSPFFTTRSGNLQVIALVNGDPVPTVLPIHLQPNLSSYLKPYLDAAGKVRIGPMSVLIMMELNETSHSDSCFDYQDVLVLVSLSKKHPNNGHGNNLDGVDVSNPGGGSGGPNGEIDLSGGYDDEIR